MASRSAGRLYVLRLPQIRPVALHKIPRQIASMDVPRDIYDHTDSVLGANLGDGIVEVPADNHQLCMAMSRRGPSSRPD